MENYQTSHIKQVLELAHVDCCAQPIVVETCPLEYFIESNRIRVVSEIKSDRKPKFEIIDLMDQDLPYTPESFPPVLFLSKFEAGHQYKGQSLLPVLVMKKPLKTSYKNNTLELILKRYLNT